MKICGDVVVWVHQGALVAHRQMVVLNRAILVDAAPGGEEDKAALGELSSLRVGLRKLGKLALGVAVVGVGVDVGQIALDGVLRVAELVGRVGLNGAADLVVEHVHVRGPRRLLDHVHDLGIVVRSDELPVGEKVLGAQLGRVLHQLEGVGFPGQSVRARVSHLDLYLHSLIVDIPHVRGGECTLLQRAQVRVDVWPSSVVGRVQQLSHGVWHESFLAALQICGGDQNDNNEDGWCIA
mmetsp:Transcript_29482/g.56618  ORF Transcript_29482/g.56618 Transcript_29482/m.56618 type:complete len:238 (-) Transcript_29482:115-828(-)